MISATAANATLPGKEKKVHELLEYVQQRAPWDLRLQ